MYRKLILATWLLAFFAVVLSAYARLSESGLGCGSWPVCYEENALKEKQSPKAGRAHSSWQWKLHAQVVQVLGLLAIALCGLSWKNRRKLRQSPLLPSLLLVLMVFLALFGILAPDFLSRPAIVTVHLAGGVIMLTLLAWISFRQTVAMQAIDAREAGRFRAYSWLGFLLLFAQIMLGGWVSSNYAALACAGFPFCNGSLLPHVDLVNILNNTALFRREDLAAIHWMHRAGALLVVLYLGWLSARAMAVDGLRTAGKILLALAVLQFMLGIFNALAGLPLAGATLHNAFAMLLLLALVFLLFKVHNFAGREGS